MVMPKLPVYEPYTGCHVQTCWGCVEIVNYCKSILTSKSLKMKVLKVGYDGMECIE